MNEIFETIQKEVNGSPIFIYMKGTPAEPQCGFSAKVVEIFNALGVPYQTRNILEDEALRNGVKQFANWPTLPQVYIKGQFIGGCDITMQMYRTGELRKLVEDLVPSGLRH